MVGSYAFAYGQVLVLRGTLPTTPRTHAGEKKMGGGQLREWDMCVEESLAVTGTYKCLYDEQLPAALEAPLRDRRRPRAASAQEREQEVRRRLAARRPARRRGGRPDVGILCPAKHDPLAAASSGARGR